MSTEVPASPVPAEPAPAPAPAPTVVPPRAVSELDKSELRDDLALLMRSRLFWTGLTIKLLCAGLFGSHFATRWFAPFVYEFVHGRFADPFQEFLRRGEPLAFPYGPGMLLSLSVSFVPALFTSFDPSGHLGLLLLRLPILGADLVICVLLMSWLRVHARELVVTYWLNPIILYATYVHGQLDLLPTAMLCASLFLLFTRRFTLGAAVFGLALATKTHLFIAAPFVVIYLYRLRRPRWAWVRFTLVSGITALALYALPLSSAAFRTMVFENAESRKIWSVVLPYGESGLMLFIAPAALMVALLRFATYRKLNRELTLMFLGAVFVGLVALVPPQPGWFIWSIPFVAYFGAQFTRAGRSALLALSIAYLGYFFVAAPSLFLEALDPTLGAAFGAASTAMLAGMIPGAFSPFTANVAWTVLFSCITLTAFQMYRMGVRSNSLYGFRESSFMIGVGGDSGAGKHTLGRDLLALMGEQLSLINGDDDHKWERGHAMWRRYTHLDPRGNLLSEQMKGLAALRSGREIRKRHYDHDLGRFTDPLLTRPNDFVCIVGLHPFYLASQRELLHLKVFVDTDESLRRSWKIARDVAKRGYTPQKVLEQIEQRQADSQKYVRPQAQHADVLIRHCPLEKEGPTALNLQVVLSGALAPLTLLDALDLVPTLEVDWQPDESLSRDRITIRGDVDAEQLKVLASAVIPNVEEVVEHEAWLPGGRGMAQLILAYAVSARLRQRAESLEAA